MVTRFLIAGEYFKSAKELIRETGLDPKTIAAVDKNPLLSFKLESIIQKFADEISASEDEGQVSLKTDARPLSEGCQPMLIEKEEEDESSDEEVDEEKLRLEKKKNEEDFRKKISQQSEMTAKINKNFVEEVDQEHRHFSRVSGISKVNSDIFDQNYVKKQQMGGDDEFGRMGHERLDGTQGREFRKQKLKMKNKDFQGGRITSRCNLIDL